MQVRKTEKKMVLEAKIVKDCLFIGEPVHSQKNSDYWVVQFATNNEELIENCNYADIIKRYNRKYNRTQGNGDEVKVYDTSNGNEKVLSSKDNSKDEVQFET